MIGYMVSFDGVSVTSSFGHTGVSLQRSVAPARARIVGGAVYDLDGMYTYPSEQTYTARFVDESGNTNARALYQRLGRYGWLTAITRVISGKNVINWAKLVSIDAEYESGDWANFPTSERNAYTLTFACSPFWYDDADTVATLTNATAWDVTNAGNAPSTWWTLYVTNSFTARSMRIGRRSGATYGIAVYGQETYDATGSQIVTYNAAKAAGDVLAIDARTNSATVNGNDQYANIVLPNTQANFGVLSPGLNRLTFNAATTGRFVFRGAYV